jgi:uncharacterized protein (DUF305 family)
MTFACSEHEDEHGAMSMPSGVEPSAGDEKAVDLYEESRMTMHHAMNVAPSGNADVDFAANMLPHHIGAVDMAKVELEHGTDPELRALAQSIIDSQTKEIEFMKAWLAKHK